MKKIKKEEEEIINLNQKKLKFIIKKMNINKSIWNRNKRNRIKKKIL